MQTFNSKIHQDRAPRRTGNCQIFVQGASVDPPTGASWRLGRVTDRSEPAAGAERAVRACARTAYVPVRAIIAWNAAAAN